MSDALTTGKILKSLESISKEIHEVSHQLKRYNRNIETQMRKVNSSEAPNKGGYLSNMKAIKEVCDELWPEYNIEVSSSPSIKDGAPDFLNFKMSAKSTPEKILERKWEVNRNSQMSFVNIVDGFIKEYNNQEEDFSEDKILTANKEE
jgi:hypothetical protein